MVRGAWCVVMVKVKVKVMEMMMVRKKCDCEVRLTTKLRHVNSTEEIH